MASKRHSAEQIVGKLREAEVELARGATVKDACRKLAITEHTYYRRPRATTMWKLGRPRKEPRPPHRPASPKRAVLPAHSPSGALHS